MEIRDWLGHENQLGIDIWEKKYRYNGESLEEWFNRVSGGNKAVEGLIRSKKFLFGGRILSNRNVPGNKTYSNCYVISPPEDNLESIFDTAKRLARTFSYGGGCGIDIGKLCPKDASVNNTAKRSSGAVSFMDLYNLTTGLIGQNGRRGALMISMPVNHPDIESFIGIKSDLTKITNANISVRITDEFMTAVQEDADYTLSFVRPETNEEITRTVKARELFRKICEMNWNYAEPGILFWDSIEKHNFLNEDENFEYGGTNPCAEEPLPPFGSCLLGALNLAEFVTNPFTKNAVFDIDGFKEAVSIAVNALNDVLDEGLPLHPLIEQQECVGKWRQIGLGIMGLADCLIKLNLTYGSNDANATCTSIAKTLMDTALNATEDRAIKFNDYPMFDYDAVNNSDMMRTLCRSVSGMNNSQLLTIAPTGSISTMIGVSGGIEPIFANSYTRKTQSLHGEDSYYKVYTPIVKQYMEKHGLTAEEQLPKQFVVAADISPRNRIDCQAVWQKYIDASISSTINLPNEATVEDVEDIYMYAWERGLKGVTVYRAGCAREGILVTDETKNKVEQAENEMQRGYIIPASDHLIGMKRTLTTGCGTLHCTAYFDPDTYELRETYLSKGSTGGCNNFMIGLSRMISLSARGGVPIEAIIDQLNSCGVCPSYAVRRATKHDTSPGSCCPIAVANALKAMHNELTNKKVKAVDNGSAKCPKCGEPLINEGGCNICKNCGWSRCD